MRWRAGGAGRGAGRESTVPAALGRGAVGGTVPAAGPSPAVSWCALIAQEIVASRMTSVNAQGVPGLGFEPRCPEGQPLLRRPRLTDSATPARANRTSRAGFA